MRWSVATTVAVEQLAVTRITNRPTCEISGSFRSTGRPPRSIRSHPVPDKTWTGTAPVNSPVTPRDTPNPSKVAN
jgi:hypothetical protein